MTKEEILNKMEEIYISPISHACDQILDYIDVESLTEDKVNQIIQIMTENYRGCVDEALYSIPQEEVRKMIIYFNLNIDSKADIGTIYHQIWTAQLETLFCRLSFNSTKWNDDRFFFDLKITNELKKVLQLWK